VISATLHSLSLAVFLFQRTRDAAMEGFGLPSLDIPQLFGFGILEDIRAPKLLALSRGSSPRHASFVARTMDSFNGNHPDGEIPHQHSQPNPRIITNLTPGSYKEFVR
jgi:hypothetical protein